jgi:hypothetical protein
MDDITLKHFFSFKQGAEIGQGYDDKDYDGCKIGEKLLKFDLFHWD